MSRLLRAAGGPWTPTSSSSGFPDASNTGANLPGNLTAVPGAATFGPGWTWSGSQSAVQVTGANAVLDSLDITGVVQVKVTATGATVKNCRISGTPSDTLPSLGVAANTPGVTINNNQITSPAGGNVVLVQLSAGVSGTTVTNNTIHGANLTTGRALYGIQLVTGSDPSLVVTGNDIAYFRVGFTADLTLAGCSYLLEGNYIHDVGFITGDHSECVYHSGPGAGHIIGNTLLNPLNQTAALIVQNVESGVTSTGPVTATGNLLAGGQYSFYGGGQPTGTALATNMTFTGNFFSTQYFPNGGNTNFATYWNPDPSNTWANNVWYDGPNAGHVIPHP